MDPNDAVSMQAMLNKYNIPPLPVVPSGIYATDENIINYMNTAKNYIYERISIMRANIYVKNKCIKEVLDSSYTKDYNCIQMQELLKNNTNSALLPKMII